MERRISFWRLLLCCIAVGLVLGIRAYTNRPRAETPAQNQMCRFALESGKLTGECRAPFAKYPSEERRPWQVKPPQATTPSWTPALPYTYPQLAEPPYRRF